MLASIAQRDNFCVSTGVVVSNWLLEALADDYIIPDNNCTDRNLAMLLRLSGKLQGMLHPVIVNI